MAGLNGGHQGESNWLRRAWWAISWLNNIDNYNDDNKYNNNNQQQQERQWQEQ